MDQLKGYFEKHYPLLLFAIYSVQYWWSLIWYKEEWLNVALSLTLILAICITIHLSVIRIKRGLKGCILSSLFIFAFLYLQDIHYLLQDIGNNVNLQLRYMSFVFVLISGLLVFSFVRSTREFIALSKALSLFLLFFFLTTAITRSLDFASYGHVQLKTASKGLLSSITLEKRPDLDVYYLVFDSYTSSESLEKYYRYDNSKFEEKLIKRGFKITRKSKSLYTSTAFSLSSVFNMEPLTNTDEFKSLTKEASLRAANLSVGNSALFKILSNSKVSVFTYSIFPILSSYNRKIIWNLSWWSKVEHIFQHTALVYLYKVLADDKTDNDQKVEQHFSDNLSRNNKSAFYFYHFYAPHGGYSPSHPLSNLPYTERVRYTNDRIISLVNKIFENNSRPFVIVIQGDHGSREVEPHNPVHPEKHSIFNAIYFPDRNYSQIKDDFKSISTFRLILNKYYGTNLPLL